MYKLFISTIALLATAAPIACYGQEGPAAAPPRHIPCVEIDAQSLAITITGDVTIGQAGTQLTTVIEALADAGIPTKQVVDFIKSESAAGRISAPLVIKPGAKKPRRR